MANIENTGLEKRISDANSHSESSDTEHFSSASEGDSRSPKRSVHSSIPQTRIERVGHEPSHGEVPGTQAFKDRAQDAVPDTVEIIPEDPQSPHHTAAVDDSAQASDMPIPRTRVERVDDKPAHGEVEGTVAKELRAADAVPDEVRLLPSGAPTGQLHGRREPGLSVENQQQWFHQMWEDTSEQYTIQASTSTSTTENVPLDDNGYDDFAEQDADDDFGDFDAAEEPSEIVPETPAQTTVPEALQYLPPLDLTNLTTDEAQRAFQPYFDALFPPTEAQEASPKEPPNMPTSSAFLSDRSLSLWQQLVSPPPMQPPNWTRSRIRRLFLVSLGVPVDLDEILPPSKQKRLVLPNIDLSFTDSKSSATLDRFKGSNIDASTTSVDSKGTQKRFGTSTKPNASSKGVPVAPEFDTNAAAILSSTTPEAMSLYTDRELQYHVISLKDLNQTASTVLEYWLQRKDEGLKEKEVLEGVIENLVGFVKGQRGK